MAALVIALIVFGFLGWLLIEAHQAPMGCDDCGGVNDCWACGAVEDRERAR